MESPGKHRREVTYRSKPFVISALESGARLVPRPGLFTPGNIRHQLCRRLGGPRVRSGWAEKVPPQSGFDPWTLQPVASRFLEFTCENNNKPKQSESCKKVMYDAIR